MRTRPASHQPAVQSNRRTGTSGSGRRANWSARRRGRSGPLRIGILRYGRACAIQAWKLLFVTRLGASTLARSVRDSRAKLRTVQPSQTNVFAARFQAQENTGLPGAVGLSRECQGTSVSGAWFGRRYHLDVGDKHADAQNFGCAALDFGSSRRLCRMCCVDRRRATRRGERLGDPAVLLERRHSGRGRTPLGPVAGPAGPQSCTPPAPSPTSERRTPRLTAMNGTASEPNG